MSRDLSMEVLEAGRYQLNFRFPNGEAVSQLLTRIHTRDFHLEPFTGGDRLAYFQLLEELTRIELNAPEVVSMGSPNTLPEHQINIHPEDFTFEESTNGFNSSLEVYQVTNPLSKILQSRFGRNPAERSFAQHNRVPKPQFWDHFNSVVHRTDSKILVPLNMDHEHQQINPQLNGLLWENFVTSAAFAVKFGGINDEQNYKLTERLVEMFLSGNYPVGLVGNTPYLVTK